MQPTLSKTSTHAPGSQRRCFPARAGVATEPTLQWRRAHFCQQFQPPHRVFSTRHGKSGAGVWRLVTGRTRRALERADVESRTTKTASTTAPLKNGGFPGQRRLPPIGSPWRALVDHGEHRVRARFDDRRPFTRRVSLRASPVCSLLAATKSAHAGPTPPTDFCNRQRAWAHRRHGSLSAQNPLFRRILSFRLAELRRHGLRS
jgi:hypothetical protein